MRELDLCNRNRDSTRSLNLQVLKYLRVTPRAIGDSEVDGMVPPLAGADARCRWSSGLRQRLDTGDFLMGAPGPV